MAEERPGCAGAFPSVGGIGGHFGAPDVVDGARARERERARPDRLPARADQDGGGAVRAQLRAVSRRAHGGSAGRVRSAEVSSGREVALCQCPDAGQERDASPRRSLPTGRDRCAVGVRGRRREAVAALPNDDDSFGASPLHG